MSARGRARPDCYPSLLLRLGGNCGRRAGWQTRKPHCTHNHKGASIVYIDFFAFNFCCDLDLFLLLSVPYPPSFYLSTSFLALLSNFFPSSACPPDRTLPLRSSQNRVESDDELRISEHKKVAGSWSWKSPKSSACIMRSGSAQGSYNVRHFITKVL